MGLIKKIEVALLKNGHNITILQIDVDPEGIVNSGGYAVNANAKADIIQVIEAVEGVTAIESAIGDINQLTQA